MRSGWRLLGGFWLGVLVMSKQKWRAELDQNAGEYTGWVTF